MKSIFICLLLVRYGMAVGLIREYIPVSQQMNWTTAQSYCRQNYWDLASITTEEENQRAVTVKTFSYGWIGLNRTAPHVNIWQWSGGEEVHFTNWHPGEPNDWQERENCALISSDRWNDFDCQAKLPFICYRRFLLVTESKTWDEALNYCRSHYNNLTLLDSDLLESEQPETASVWAGLRFLDGRWFWVNGMPLGSLVSLPSCPVQPYRCGAYNLNTNAWEIRDCSEELNFLCYY